MYLSRLILDPRSRQVRSEMANPYQLHRTVMSAFPERLPPDERVLFRLEVQRKTGIPILLVQSQYPPDWSAVQPPRKSRYLLLSERGEWEGENPAVKSVQMRLVAGQVLAFRLRANPTVRRNGKRLGLYREEEQQGWLQRKLQEAGARLLEARQDDQGRVNGTLYRQGLPHRLQFLAVNFEGLLRVEDAERLTLSIRNGIGSGKGLGFGLLSLAPA